jgi:hypothetical protein
LVAEKFDLIVKGSMKLMCICFVNDFGATIVPLIEVLGIDFFKLLRRLMDDY